MSTRFPSILARPVGGLEPSECTSNNIFDEKIANLPIENREALNQRFTTLFEVMGASCIEDGYSEFCYMTIDIPQLAKTRYSQEFAGHIVNDHDAIDFAWRLAEEK
ncbi:MAG: hypothetical protein ACI92Z_002397 [Paracoccaceae bacterium]